MRIDVSELMNCRLNEVRFDYTFDTAHTDLECVAMPEDINIPDGGIRVEGRISDSMGCMTMRAHVTVNYSTPCARCLETTVGVLEFDFERMIMTNARKTQNRASHLSENGEWDGELDDVLFVNDAAVIPDRDIMEEISLEMPSFTMCSEDCRGLCPKCGKRIADGDCGCKDEKEINPKLAILKKLLDKQE